MNKRYLYIIALALLIASHSLRAQQWNGSTSTSGDIDRSGNVGIGDSTPSSALSIRGFTPPNGDGIWGDEDTLTFQNGSLGDNGSYGLWLKWNVYRKKYANTQHFLNFSGRDNAADMYFSEYGIWLRTAETTTESAGDSITMSNRMVILPGGNVGVGTTGPERRLEVGDETSDFSAYARLDGSWNSDYKKHARLEFNDKNFGIGVGRMSTSGDDDLYFWTYNADGRDIRFMSTSNGESSVSTWATNMVITGDDGNVGIGEVDPSYKLEVNGTIRAKEIIVESTGWSDFVFEDGYDLPTLDEVSSFIGEHGHLPDIPSAEEVAVNGITLGTMNSKLLQKIEELTLYTLEQQKTIGEQHRSLEKQAQQISKQHSMLEKLVDQNNQLHRRLEAAGL